MKLQVNITTYGYFYWTVAANMCNRISKRKVVHGEHAPLIHFLIIPIHNFTITKISMRRSRWLVDAELELCVSGLQYRRTYGTESPCMACTDVPAPQDAIQKWIRDTIDELYTGSIGENEVIHELSEQVTFTDDGVVRQQRLRESPVIAQPKQCTWSQSSVILNGEAGSPGPVYLIQVSPPHCITTLLSFTHWEGSSWWVLCNCRCMDYRAQLYSHTNDSTNYTWRLL